MWGSCTIPKFALIEWISIVRQAASISFSNSTQSTPWYSRGVNFFWHFLNLDCIHSSKFKILLFSLDFFVSNKAFWLYSSCEEKKLNLLVLEDMKIEGQLTGVIKCNTAYNLMIDPHQEVFQIYLVLKDLFAFSKENVLNVDRSFLQFCSVCVEMLKLLLQFYRAWNLCMWHEI